MYPQSIHVAFPTFGTGYQFLLSESYCVNELFSAVGIDEKRREEKRKEEKPVFPTVSDLSTSPCTQAEK